MEQLEEQEMKQLKEQEMEQLEEQEMEQEQEMEPMRNRKKTNEEREWYKEVMWESSAGNKIELHVYIFWIITGTTRKGSTKEISMNLNSEKHFYFSDDWFARLPCLGKSMAHNHR